MGCVTRSDIRVTGALELDNIEKLQICIVPNEHGKARICAIVNKEIIEKVKRVDCRQVIKVVAKQRNIFCGIIKDLKWYYEGEIIHLEVELYSMSALIDEEYKKKSFQNCAMSVGEVIKAISERCYIVLNAKDKEMVTPTYQWRETDWQFMRRMVAKLENCIYPDVQSEKISVNIGMPNEEQEEILESEKYNCGVGSDYFSQEKLYGMVDKSYFVFYQLESYKDFDIGKRIRFENHIMNILEKEIFTRGEELLYRYKLGNKKSCYLRQYFNLNFSGMSISGRVLATKNQFLKIHLDIDDTQIEKDAYWYKWIPETGNAMYCMPQKGTRVQLYFKNENEDSAIAISCIRENGEKCEKMGNAEDKYFSNGNGKQLFFRKEEIGIGSEDKEKRIVADDILGMKIESDKMLNIISGKQVKLKANKITLNTPTEIKMIQG